MFEPSPDDHMHISQPQARILCPFMEVCVEVENRQDFVEEEFEVELPECWDTTRDHLVMTSEAPTGLLLT
jgi:hypothetical protein